MFYWKIDVIKALEEKKINTTIIRNGDKARGIPPIMGQKTYYDIKAGNVCGIKVLDTICRLTGKQPGQLIAWKPDPIPAAAAADKKTE